MFIFRGSTGNYFRGVGEQAHSFRVGWVLTGFWAVNLQRYFYG